MHDVGLRRTSVAHVGHVADVDHRAVHRLDGQVVQLIDNRRGGVGFDGVLEAVDLHRPRGHDQVLRGDGVDHIDRREPFGLQSVQVQVHLNLALLAAVRKGRLLSLDSGQLGADIVLTQVVQLLFVEPLTREAQHQNGHAGGVVLNDERRQRTGRQTAQLHLADGRDLGYGAGDVDLRMKKYFDESDAVERLRLDVLDVVDRSGHAPLAVGHDAVGHFLRRKAGEVPHHRDHRNVDVGEDVRGHRLDAEDAENQD